MQEFPYPLINVKNNIDKENISYIKKQYKKKAATYLSLPALLSVV